MKLCNEKVIVCYSQEEEGVSEAVVDEVETLR